MRMHSVCIFPSSARQPLTFAHLVTAILSRSLYAFTNELVSIARALKLKRCAERGRLAMRCMQCGTGRHLQRVALPYVFRHLVTELAAMNIKCTLDVR